MGKTYVFEGKTTTEAIEKGLNELKVSKSKTSSLPVSNTPGLFSDEEIIISEILSVDTDNITPINALQTITRWKKSLSGQ